MIYEGLVGFDKHSLDLAALHRSKRLRTLNPMGSSASSRSSTVPLDKP